MTATPPASSTAFAIGVIEVSSMKRIKPQVEFKFNQHLVEHGILQPENVGMEQKIGKTIANRLAALNKTQGWLAEQAGVSINAVSKWTLTGKISRSKAVLVAEVLGLSLDELLVIENPKTANQPKSLALVYVDTEELYLLTLYRESAQDGRAFIIATAEDAPKVSQPRLSSNSDKS